MSPDQFTRLLQEIAAAATITEANEILRSVEDGALTEEQFAKATDAVNEK